MRGLIFEGLSLKKNYKKILNLKVIFFWRHVKMLSDQFGKTKKFRDRKN
jgi:hypothetical protein